MSITIAKVCEKCLCSWNGDMAFFKPKCCVDQSIMTKRKKNSV